MHCATSGDLSDESIALAEVASVTTSLKILEASRPIVAHGDDVINVQSNAVAAGGPTHSAAELVASEYVGSQRGRHQGALTSALRLCSRLAFTQQLGRSDSVVKLVEAPRGLAHVRVLPFGAGVAKGGRNRRVGLGVAELHSAIQFCFDLLKSFNLQPRMAASTEELSRQTLIVAMVLVEVGKSLKSRLNFMFEPQLAF